MSNLTTATTHHAVEALAESGDLVRIRIALESAGEAVFDWAAGGDHLQWIGGEVDDPAVSAACRIRTGQEYLQNVEEQGRAARERAIRSAVLGNGTYQAQYQFLHGMNQISWLEERGTCFLDQSGELQRIVGVVRDITQQKKQESRLAFLATYDELTGHLNRARLCASLNEALTQVHRYDRPGGYLVIGLDGLGVINESHGYDIADELILLTSDRISHALRKHDLMGRIAGNKFGVVLPNAGEEDMKRVADRLLSSMRSTPFDTSAGKIIATVSIGAVVLDKNVRSSQEAMGRAEEALSAAKRGGHDCYNIHQHSPDRVSWHKQNRQVADRIVSALKQDRMRLAFQPIVDAYTGETKLYECLLRMEREDGSYAGAGEFIPLAEQLGLIRLIDQRVLELVVAEARKRPGAIFSFNVSGLTVSGGPWLQRFIDVIKENDELAGQFVVEITETLALHEIEETANFVRKLRELGCQVAIDDFGAGYTSFRNLQRLDVDIVKIDGAFVKGLADNPDNQVFVKTLVTLAKNFGIRVIAEWVEDAREVELLRDYGVDLLQGYYFGAAEFVIKDQTAA